jgi:transposase-like protein
VPGLIRTHKIDGRNVYDGAAKRELARWCMQPGVSVARAALVNGINANVLRKWIVAEGLGGKAVRRKKKGVAPMLPVTVKPPVAQRIDTLSSGVSLEIELPRGRVLLGHKLFKELFSTDCLGSRGLIHQIEALERLPRSCATRPDRRKLLHLRFTGCLLAQFIAKLLDSGAAACLTLAGKSLYSRRSGLIFGSEVLKCHLPTGRRAWRGPGIKAYMRENLLDGRALKDRRNDLQLTAAVRAGSAGRRFPSTQGWRMRQLICSNSRLRLNPRVSSFAHPKRIGRPRAASPSSGDGAP